jgi:hypothetical protein
LCADIILRNYVCLQQYIVVLAAAAAAATTGHNK